MHVAASGRRIVAAPANTVAAAILAAKLRQHFCANRIVTTKAPAGSDDAHDAPAIKDLSVAGASDDPT